MVLYAHDVEEFMDTFNALPAPEDKKKAIEQRKSLTAEISNVREQLILNFLINNFYSHSTHTSAQFGWQNNK